MQLIKNIKYLLIITCLLSPLPVFAWNDRYQQIEIDALRNRVGELEQRQGSSVNYQLLHLQHLENMKRINNNVNVLFKAIYLCCDGKKNYCDFLDRHERLTLSEAGLPPPKTSNATKGCNITRSRKGWQKYKMTGEVPVWKYSAGILGFGGSWKAYFSDGTKFK